MDRSWTMGTVVNISTGSLSPWRCDWGSCVDHAACHSCLGCPVPSSTHTRDPDQVRASPIGRALKHSTGLSSAASKIGLGLRVFQYPHFTGGVFSGWGEATVPHDGASAGGWVAVSSPPELLHQRGSTLATLLSNDLAWHPSSLSLGKGNGSSLPPCHPWLWLGDSGFWGHYPGLFC